MTEPETSPPDPESSAENSVPENATPPAPEPPEHSEEELRLALKAFRKKLKLTQLDEESRLGYGPTSKGEKSRVAAITPPHQYARSVWKQLAREGKLRQETKSLYSLNE